MQTCDKNKDELIRQLKMVSILQGLFEKVDAGEEVLLCTTHGTMYPVDWSILLMDKKIPQEDWHLCTNGNTNQLFTIPRLLQRLGYEIKSGMDIPESTANCEGEGYSIVIEEHYLKKIERAIN